MHMHRRHPLTSRYTRARRTNESQTCTRSDASLGWVTSSPCAGRPAKPRFLARGPAWTQIPVPARRVWEPCGLLITPGPRCTAGQHNAQPCPGLLSMPAAGQQGGSCLSAQKARSRLADDTRYVHPHVTMAVLIPTPTSRLFHRTLVTLSRRSVAVRCAPLPPLLPPPGGWCTFKIRAATLVLYTSGPRPTLPSHFFIRNSAANALHMPLNPLSTIVSREDCELHGDAGDGELRYTASVATLVTAQVGRLGCASSSRPEWALTTAHYPRAIVLVAFGAGSIASHTANRTTPDALSESSCESRASSPHSEVRGPAIAAARLRAPQAPPESRPRALLIQPSSRGAAGWEKAGRGRRRPRARTASAGLLIRTHRRLPLLLLLRLTPHASGRGHGARTQGSRARGACSVRCVPRERGCTLAVPSRAPTVVIRGRVPFQKGKKVRRRSHRGVCAVAGEQPVARARLEWVQVAPIRACAHDLSPNRPAVSYRVTRAGE